MEVGTHCPLWNCQMAAWYKNFSVNLNVIVETGVCNIFVQPQRLYARPLGLFQSSFFFSLFFFFTLTLQTKITCCNPIPSKTVQSDGTENAVLQWFAPWSVIYMLFSSAQKCPHNLPLGFPSVYTTKCKCHVWAVPVQRGGADADFHSSFSLFIDTN